MHKGTPIAAADVDLMFHAATKHGPWPDAKSCRRLANLLESIRCDPWHTRKLAADALKEEKKRRDLVRRVLTLIGEREAEWKSLADEHVSARERFAYPPLGRLDTGATRALGDARAAVERAKPYILRPWIQTRRSPWHSTAWLIAVPAEEALRAAGWQRIAYHRDSPLVRFISAAMQRATMKTYEPAAVAMALRRIPAKK